jgi:hypothetical protein
MWLIQLCCGLLGPLKEIVRSFRFGKEYLRYYRSFGEKWDSEGTYGCYGNNLLFYPIPFYFSIQLFMVKNLMGMGLLSRVWDFFIINELPHL